MPRRFLNRMVKTAYVTGDNYICPRCALLQKFPNFKAYNMLNHEK